MRARGAQVTDIAVLVVAADDGIMPQTIEAIDHARAAGVPIVVAINKVDLPGSDLERVKRQLADNNLLIEEWGGDVIAVPVSALKGEGVTDLLENMLVLAEVGELKTNPSSAARGVVVEARKDKNRGNIATVLVQSGTLKVGDNTVFGDIRGRVKALYTDQGQRVQEALPSQPVEIFGIDGLPEAGEIFEVAPDEKTARSMVEERRRERELRRSSGPHSRRCPHADRVGRGQGLEPDRQDRRPGDGRGGTHLAGGPQYRAVQSESGPHRQRQHHRERRTAGRRLEGHHNRFQHHAGERRARPSPTRRGSTSAPTRSSIT